MLWSDFVAEVNAQLSVEANRRGLESFRDRFIRNAVLDLQRFIPAFCQGLTTTYLKADVTALDKCSLVQLPTGAKPRELWQYSTDPADDLYCKRYRLDFYPWAARQDLVCGKLDFGNWWAGGCWPTGTCPPPAPQNCNGWNWCERKRYVYTIAPHGTNFLVYPAINDKTALLLLWDGYKTAFVDSDTIPFYDGTAEAVAAYLMWKLALYVDKNPSLAREHQAFWKERRLSLYRDWQETQDAEGKGDEYDGQTVSPPSMANFQAGFVSLAMGDGSAAIVFPTAYTNPPIVDCWIVGPSGAAFSIGSFPDGSTITASGFTAIFAGLIPDNSGYKLYWNAMIAS